MPDQNEAVPKMLMTVTGPLPIHAISGIILVHEHLFVNSISRHAHQYNPFVTNTPANKDPLSIENLAAARLNPQNVPNCLRLESIEDAIFEMNDFKLKGGGLILCSTNVNEGSNTRGLRTVSLKTGLPIVMGASILDEHQTVDEICNSLVKQLQVGDVTEISLDDGGIRAGFIGEILIRGIFHENNEQNNNRQFNVCLSPREEIMLISAAKTQSLHSTMLLINFSMLIQQESKKSYSDEEEKENLKIWLKIIQKQREELILSVVQLLEANGADLNRLLISGVEELVINNINKEEEEENLKSSNKPSFLHSLIDQGVSIVCSGFGKYCAFHSVRIDSNHIPVPYHDEILVQMVSKLQHVSSSSSSSFSNKRKSDVLSKGSIFLSNGIENKLQLKKYGGFGYSHLCDEDHVIAQRFMRHGFDSNENSNRINSGGGGGGGGIECSTTIQELFLGHSVLEKLSWWTPPKPKQVIVFTSICSWCEKKFVYDDNQHYSKFSFEYCKSKCLR